MSYETIGKQLQIERDWCHDDINGTIVPKHVGIIRFNEEAIKNGLEPLRDPVGYMALEGNVYQLIKDIYEEKYDAKAQEIENGFSMGTTYAMDAILDNLNSVVRKDARHFTPNAMNYGELRFVAATDEIERAIEKMVDKRVEMTLKYSISRSVSDESFMKSYQQFKDAGSAVALEIENAGYDSVLDFGKDGVLTL